MYYKIIDNFLREDIFEEVKNNFYSDKISWVFKNFIAYPGDNLEGICFTQSLYNEGEIRFAQYFSIVEPLIQKIQIKNLHRALLNLSPRQKTNIPSGIHNDHEFEHYVLIYYIDTNNGSTILYNGNKKIEVECIENRALIFDGSLPHQGIMQTDTLTRSNINLTFSSFNRNKIK